MDIQTTIVLIAIAIATELIGMTLYRKIRTFSPKRGYGDDCGCNAGSKKLQS